MLRVTGFDTPYPAARIEEEYLPDLDRVWTPSTGRWGGEHDAASGIPVARPW